MKNVPLRRCLINKKMYPTDSLFRIVKTKVGEVFFDNGKKLNGRGSYLLKDKATILKAQKINIIAKVFQVEVNINIYEEMLKAL